MLYCSIDTAARAPQPTPPNQHPTVVKASIWPKMAKSVVYGAKMAVFGLHILILAP